MPTIDYLPFANSGGANVIDQASYGAAPWLPSGFSAGIAVAEQLNKVWRQSSVMSAAMANYISAKTGLDVLDDGDVAALITKLTAAITAGSAVRASRIVTVSTALAVTLADYAVGLNRTVSPAATAATLPTGAVAGQEFVIDDLSKNAALFPITVTPPGGQNIAGDANFIMNVNKQCAVFRYYGSNIWSVNA